MQLGDICVYQWSFLHQMCQPSFAFNCITQFHCSTASTVCDIYIWGCTTHIFFLTLGFCFAGTKLCKTKPCTDRFPVLNVSTHVSKVRTCLHRAITVTLYSCHISLCLIINAFNVERDFEECLWYYAFVIHALCLLGLPW